MSDNYIYKAPEFTGITFCADGAEQMLLITKDAFYVRGVKVEQGPGEALEVYNAVLKLCGLERYAADPPPR